jgi:gliding motility-associated lipoprotein GldD
MKKPILIVFVLLGILVTTGCSETFTPKPKGFFRIDLPAKSYQNLSDTLPYFFEFPDYALVKNDIHQHGEKGWINIEFPQFNGILHISYKEVDQNLDVFTEDARTLVFKHIPKASAINNKLILQPERRVFGTLFEIDGKGTASPVQFYLTDSTNHFLRAALYFNVRPNNDSLAPVIEFLKADVEHMIQTFYWR